VPEITPKQKPKKTLQQQQQQEHKLSTDRPCNHCATCTTMLHNCPKEDPRASDEQSSRFS
jgi:hypothetical protein